MAQQTLDPTRRRALEAELVARAEQDPQFRQELLAQPNVAVGRALGVEIPAGFTIRVHEETAREFHLVLPAAEASQAPPELADSDVEGYAMKVEFQHSGCVPANDDAGGWICPDNPPRM